MILFSETKMNMREEYLVMIGENPWKLKMDEVLMKLVFRMQYRDILDTRENWIKQLFC